MSSERWQVKYVGPVSGTTRVYPATFRKEAAAAAVAKRLVKDGFATTATAFLVQK